SAPSRMIKPSSIVGVRTRFSHPVFGKCDAWSTSTRRANSGSAEMTTGFRPTRRYSVLREYSLTIRRTASAKFPLAFRMPKTKKGRWPRSGQDRGPRADTRFGRRTLVIRLFRRGLAGNVALGNSPLLKGQRLPRRNLNFSCDHLQRSCRHLHRSRG